MPLTDMQDPSQQTPSDSVPPPSEDGYRIYLDVLPDGFHVSDPQPLPAAPQGEQETQDDIPDLTTAIKHLLAVVKANPIGQDANEQMKAGYESA